MILETKVHSLLDAHRDYCRTAEEDDGMDRLGDSFTVQDLLAWESNDNPKRDRAREAIEALTEDERLDLLALYFAGREDNDEWGFDAWRKHAEAVADGGDVDYLMDKADLAEGVEQGLDFLERRRHRSN